MPADPDASKYYDPTAEEYYYGYGCTIVSTGSKIPITAEFTESKQAPEETAMRVTRDALAVAKPMWMLGDSAYDTLDWHDHLLAAGIVPVTPYNPRNTDEPKDIEYRAEDRIEEHSEDVQLKQPTLDKTYNRRIGVERTNESVKDCGLGRVFARGRVKSETLECTTEGCPVDTVCRDRSAAVSIAQRVNSGDISEVSNHADD